MSSNLLTMIVPLKDGASADHLKHPRVDLIEIRGPLPSIAQGFLDGICKATTEWVILANDDITITPQNVWDGTQPPFDWVDILEEEIQVLPDPFWLLHPDDGCFGPRLSIFPILHRLTVLEHLDLIPPFRRYCLDPHLHAIFKAIGRVKYLPQILFDHQNFYTRENLPAWASQTRLNYGKHGRIYLCKPGPDVDFDSQLAQSLQPKMQAVAEALHARIQERQHVTEHARAV